MRRRGFSFSSAAASTALTCFKYTHTYPLLMNTHYVVTLSETTECSARAKNFILWFAAGSMHFNIVWHFLALFFTYCIWYNYFQQLFSFLNVFPTVFPTDQWSCGLATAVQTHCCRMSFIQDVWQLHLKVGSGKAKSTFNMRSWLLNSFFSAKWNRENLFNEPLFQIFLTHVRESMLYSLIFEQTSAL